MAPWRIWVDTGGTFTDCLAIAPNEELHRLKVLSNGSLRGRLLKQLSATSFQVELVWPVVTDCFSGFQLRVLGSHVFNTTIQRVDITNNVVEIRDPFKKFRSGDTFEIFTGEEVPVFAARLLTQTRLIESFPPIDMKLGSTRGTNAILERKGAKAAFVVTRGFKDLLVIGNQQRPDLFTLNIKKEPPLYHEVIEIDERIAADGSVITAINSSSLVKLVTALKRKKIESVAIALVNSYKNPAHEKWLKERLIDAGFRYVSASHELSGQIRILPRAETTVANAYLAPIIHSYLNNIHQCLSNGNLKIMTSAGGLFNIQSFHPKDSLLSGPAGGVVGAATTAALSGIDKLITFDMGGTSTDVSLYNQRFDYRYESQVGKIKILSPSLAIETIAAGGGSICSFDGHRFTVGPESAGAYPGPACYGAGGPLTITDVNLLLGRIDPADFAMPLSVDKAERALNDLLNRVEKKTRKSYTGKQVLLSLVQIANEKMAEAIKKVSTQAGFNPADFTLLSFGGAGGQHACALASMLNMKQLLIPYDAGLLSAYGIGHAKVERFREQLVLRPLAESIGSLTKWIQQLHEHSTRDLIADGFDADKITLDKTLAFIRFRGQESSLEVPFQRSHTTLAELVASFKKQYEAVFGHWLSEREIELESVRVITSVVEQRAHQQAEKPTSYLPIPVRKNKKLSIYKWEQLKPGATLQGPALVVSNNSTTAVDAGWQFRLDENNNALLTSIAKQSSKTQHAEEAELELFTNRFTAIAQEMGALLQRTSFSVNVKERLDFSCAVLDNEGRLVVNAPHIPVHLGSLGVCVREVVKAIEVAEGDVIITNHPAFGGSHLPDVTLIKAVYFQGKKIGYVANRAHHAEIGGKKPGSMPADARTLDEEGVIIAPTYLVRGGQPQWQAVQKLFTQCKFPTRLWVENQADLNGALAAVNYGEIALQELCARHSLKRVAYFLDALRTYSATLLRQSLATLPGKTLRGTERLDDGSVLSVAMKRKGKKWVFDFSGSARVHPGNLNATKAIVQSAVLYVLRLLVNKPIPMNEGMMENVEIILPHGLLNPDFTTGVLPAVVGGNTEVSQRLTDTLLKALGLAACSQGTMNNFLFGNELFGYYETICGGTGAGKGFDGAHAVHQHMTNTRITDPELLEFRYPIRLERFEVRKNSGGNGRWKGGDGIIREFTFLDALDINILSQHRKEKPYGLNGAEPGKVGAQRVIRTAGVTDKLKGMDSARVDAGDRLIIETPGGGGFGKMQSKKSKKRRSDRRL